jgi:hypothetical protein
MTPAFAAQFQETSRRQERSKVVITGSSPVMPARTQSQKGGLSQRVRTKRGPMIGSGVIRHIGGVTAGCAVKRDLLAGTSQGLKDRGEIALAMTYHKWYTFD